MNRFSHLVALLSKKKLGATTLAPHYWSSLNTAGLTGLVLLVPIAYSNPIAHAEPENSKTSSKLKIYDDPKPDIVLVETPTRLERTIREMRIHATNRIKKIQDQFQEGTDRWISFEQKAESNIKEVISPNERLMPETLYIAVAALAGTVLSGNRGIIMRIASPIGFTIAASYYFLPRTSRNIAIKLAEYEQKSPKLMRIHNSISQTANESKQKIDEGVTKLRSLFDGRAEKIKQEAKNMINVRPCELAFLPVTPTWDFHPSHNQETA
ncbi:hypothetical protein G9A89_017824 [Geosiphon pyriformis]|nr:hypothetical protein G9A89_017824 [Geosiphon pyriformis]